ncbi:structural maintenance of chromosomes protein 6 [Nematocida ausubeli]|nr:structural maintenance of chromosomes protein 6 [Nematocida ausubeli]KAI5162945.1 structural maintenance of chromosomes protein 6 [Nematocida ausubeli]
MRNETGCFLQNIQLVNFMCHDNLYVAFTKKVTCLVGNNGSGKSAIMIALGVLFGVRATAMRGHSYKQYIKTGEDYSVIRVELKVKGESLQPDVIVIEKRLSPESSRIRITTNGEASGKTQDDLNALIEQLRINLRNPLCFLTQDQAKKILKAHNLKSIYSFFKSATDIENIENNQIHDQLLLQEIKKSLEAATTRQANKEKTLEAVANRLEIKDAIISAEESIRRLKVEYAWGRAHQEEKRRIAAEREREHMLNEYASKSQEKKNNLAKLEEITGKLSVLAQKKNSLQVRRQDRLDQIKETLGKNERRKVEILKELEQSEYDIEQMKKKISRIEQILGRPAETSEDQKKSEESLAAALKELNNEKNQNEKEQAQLAVQKAQTELTISKVHKEIESLEQSSQKKQLILQSYKQQSPIKFYGPAMEAAIAEIKAQNLEVTGPIGLEIHVKDKKWSRATESALGSCIFGFILHCKNVKARLEGIFAKHKVHRYQIYVTTPHAIRKDDRILEKALKVSQSIMQQASSVSSSPVTTVLAQIQDSNPLVVEQLIILLGIEKIGLLDNRQSAYTLLQKKVGFEFFLTPAPDRIQYIGTSLSDMRCTVREKQLLVSQESETELLHEIEKMKEQQKELFQRKNTLIASSGEIQSALASHHEKQALIQDRIAELEEEIKRRETMQTDVLEIEYKNSIQMMDAAEKQKVSVAETYKEVLHEIAASQAEIVRILEENKCAQEREEALHKKEIKQYTLEHENITQASQENEALLASLQRRIDKMNSHLEMLHKECACLRDTAMDLSSQHILHVEREPNEIEGEIISLTAKSYAYSSQPALHEMSQIEGMDSTILDEEEERRVLLEKKKELECEIARINMLLQENQEEIEEIEKGTLERVRKREDLTYKISNSSIRNFSDLMSMREYSGSLEFDHQKEVLDIRVKVTEASKGDKNSLSGGERSFSGLCFLLSLWPLITSPLRILDEFDVFMDALNRKAALNLIFETARRIDTQVIIITPLGVSNPPADICDVITLKPPVR